MTSEFPWQNSVSLCPLLAFVFYSQAKFTCSSRYLLTSYFCIPVPLLVLEGLVGLHRTIQLQLLQHYSLGHRLLWYWMVCLWNKQDHSICSSALNHEEPTTDPYLHQRLLDTPQASLGQSLVRSLFLSPGSWCAQVLFVPSKSLSPQSCGSSGSSMGRVNGNLLQDGLYHTQVCCTQSPCPCSRPLLTQTSTGDIRTQFWLSLCGVPRSWCALDLF